MADAKNTAIQEAYDKVRSDKDPATWLLLDYDSPTSNKLTLTKTGEGANSIEELAAKLSDDKASFGYVRVKYQNDEQSFREKFVLVIFIGSNVKVMRRARVSVYAADVKNVLRTYSIEVNASSKDDLKESDVVSQLRKAGGANYNRSNFT
ncbi:hypothetical protein HD553DRAFT_361129 [Filobasidium floriforme]|uniref:uncharacterized protein n=1 Tax=Filobasidium floriforme TaxID=5210 RepID=UPI001E8CF1D9|nr:uncharacterized protein HD553DRAFT_361129 [Filobasidium floriforme]KAH8080860.1 hypothetical protein HD553DRAFT_361129 [Filobasidium floriforme]